MKSRVPTDRDSCFFSSLDISTETDSNATFYPESQQGTFIIYHNNVTLEKEEEKNHCLIKHWIDNDFTRLFVIQ